LHISEGRIQSKLERRLQRKRKDLLAIFRCRYFAPFDARRTLLPNDSVDLVYSHTVLEHIPPAIIDGIPRESYRILKPDGITCHVIDNSDHWIQRDGTISYVNFLRYEDWVWKLISINPIDSQNRLRNYEYIALLEKWGFHIILDRPVLEQRALPAFNTLKLCRRYASVPKEQLALCRLNIIARAAKEKQSVLPRMRETA